MADQWEVCRYCGCRWYWHEHRRADDPMRFTLGVCTVCGCDHLQPRSWGVP